MVREGKFKILRAKLYLLIEKKIISEEEADELLISCINNKIDILIQEAKILDEQNQIILSVFNETTADNPLYADDESYSSGQQPFSEEALALLEQARELARERSRIIQRMARRKEKGLQEMVDDNNSTTTLTE